MKECNLLIYADESYVKHAGVLCMSIALNASKENIYNIFFCYTGNECISSLLTIENDLSVYKNIKLKFLEITEHINSGILSKSNKPYISDNIYAKLYLFQKLPVNMEKVLFLDSDTIVLNDVINLYKIDISNVILAARSEPQTFEKYYGIKKDANLLGLENSDQYFNSGVMLINLKKWREESVSEKAIKFLKDKGHDIYLHDQDGLNSIIKGNWLELPHEWHPHYKNVIFTNGGFVARLTDRELAKINIAGLAHFLGRGKPWKPGCKNPWKDNYLYYLSKTSFKDLYESVLKIHKRERKMDSIKKFYNRLLFFRRLIKRPLILK